jgi:hypothetical protein
MRGAIPPLSHLKHFTCYMKNSVSWFVCDKSAEAAICLSSLDVVRLWSRFSAPCAVVPLRGENPSKLSVCYAQTSVMGQHTLLLQAGQTEPCSKRYPGACCYCSHHVTITLPSYNSLRYPLLWNVHKLPALNYCPTCCIVLIFLKFPFIHMKEFTATHLIPTLFVCKLVNSSFWTYVCLCVRMCVGEGGPILRTQEKIGLLNIVQQLTVFETSVFTLHFLPYIPKDCFCCVLKMCILLTYLLTYLFTPWPRILFEKLSLSLSKKILLSYGTRRFITLYTKAHHWTLS